MGVDGFNFETQCVSENGCVGFRSRQEGCVSRCFLRAILPLLEKDENELLELLGNELNEINQLEDNLNG